MEYSEAIEDLIDAAKDSGLSINLTYPNTDTTFHELAFGGALAAIIKEEGYPGDTELPWSVEELYLYSLDDLESRQAGYRSDANTGEPSDSWDKSRFVIADWAANPVSIDRQGGISYSRHGEGAWTYNKISSSLPEFFAVLAAWLRYFVGERGGNLFDENFEISQESRDDISHKVLSALPPKDRDAALAFFLGEI